jgi:hypothetical protein
MDCWVPVGSVLIVPYLGGGWNRLRREAASRRVDAENAKEERGEGEGREPRGLRIKVEK